jgi:hypothetical protein
MAIKRNSSGFISSYSSDADFKGKQLKARELLKYMYDGDKTTICMGKDFNGEPDFDSLTGDLDLGSLGWWHNVHSYYEVRVGNTLPDWKPESPYIIRYHASDEEPETRFSYLYVKDVKTGNKGWIDSRAVDLI